MAEQNDWIAGLIHDTSVLGKQVPPYIAGELATVIRRKIDQRLEQLEKPTGGFSSPLDALTGPGIARATLSLVRAALAPEHEHLGSLETEVDELANALPTPGPAENVDLGPVVHMRHSVDRYPLCWPMDRDGDFIGTDDENSITCSSCLQELRRLV